MSKGSLNKTFSEDVAIEQTGKLKAFHFHKKPELKYLMLSHDKGSFLSRAGQ